jgi:hypothetical protein
MKKNARQPEANAAFPKQKIDIHPHVRVTSIAKINWMNRPVVAGKE